MVTRIDTIFSVTRHRELRRRRQALMLHISLVTTAVAVPVCLAWWYPTWTLLLWIAPLGTVALLWKHSEKPTLSISREELALLVDTKLDTKERFQSFAYLSRSSEAPDLVRSAFIAQQIEEALPQTFNPHEIVSTSLSPNQRIELGSAIACAVITLTLILFRPLSPLESIARHIVTVVKENPSLPESVKQSALDTALRISSADLDDARLALENTRDEISRAIEDGIEAQQDEQTIPPPDQQRSLSPVETSPQKHPVESAPPRDKNESAKQRDSKKHPQQRQQQESPQQQNPSDKQSEPEEQKDESKSEGSEQTESSGDKKKNDEDKKDSKETSSSKEQSGKSQSSSQSDSKEAEEGEGQGTGQGSSGSGTGSQGEGQQEGQQAEGSSGKGKSARGSGTGESSGEQSGEENQSSSPQHESSQQKSGAAGTNGLQQLNAALSKAEQEISKQEEYQNQQQQGEQGNKGDGNSDKEGDTGKQQDKSGAEKGKNSQQGKDGEENPNPKEQGQGKGASKKSQQQENKKGDGEGKSQKRDAQEEQGAKGPSASNGKPPQDAREHVKDLPEGDLAEGRGEKSSMPDRSAQAKNEMPGDGPPSDIPKGPLEFKESHLKGDNEQFDARFTGSESKLEESSSPARAKTTLEDVLLAKPRGSLQKGKQPIPLEYKEILE